ncbi:MAG: DUF4292 domain-containing protein [Weeksellaceae bacterium]
MLFILMLFVLQSCGTAHRSAKVNKEVESQNLATFKANYETSLPKFQYLQVKSRIDADLDGKSQNATLRLYFDKDQMIWANASLMGITGARAKITPESVQAYEIIDKTYINDNFDYINQKLKVNFIDFEKLQQLLLGQLFLIGPWEDYQVTTTSDNQYELSYKYNDDLKSKPRDNQYIHTFYLDGDYKLKKVDVIDSKSNTHITVDYTDWKIVNNQTLPGAVKIMVKGKKTDQINLNYNNFDFSEMNPPFRIPDNYKERTLK